MPHVAFFTTLFYVVVMSDDIVLLMPPPSSDGADIYARERRHDIHSRRR